MRGKSPLRSGLSSLATQKLPSAISGTNSSFGRGKSPPRSKPKVFRYPLSGMALFFSAAVATLRRKLFPMPATPIGHEFLRFSARRKMGAFATKQKLEEQAPACDMPATPIKREFLRFFCFAKKWSLCDQVKTQRASGSLRHARNAQKILSKNL